MRLPEDREAVADPVGQRPDLERPLARRLPGRSVLAVQLQARDVSAVLVTCVAVNGTRTL